MTEKHISDMKTQNENNESVMKEIEKVLEKIALQK